MRVGIIGAGAAGLAALRHSLEQGHDCIAFEQTELIGGTWNYTDRTDVDAHGLAIHSSMYQGLMTNLPKDLMEYQDFAYQELDRSFIGQTEVLKYIEHFAEHYTLHQHIKFLRHILEVTALPDQKWKLKEKNLETNEVTEHTFDALMVCIGNFSVPRLPKIPGMELLEEKAIHSHRFRRAGSYKGKRVLVIGAGPSGIDIAKLVGEVAEKVYISYGTTLFLKTEDYVLHKPVVKTFEKNKAIFEDGTEVEIDNVIYCTGYQYSYPFLTPGCGISVENNWVKYLYKHVVNVERPTMGFIGIPFKVCPFPTFDIQVRFFLEFIKDTTKFTKEEMITDILKDFHQKAVPSHHVHKIGMSLHQAYFDDMADTVKIKKVRPVIHKLYEHVSSNRNIHKRYSILNDEEFVEVA